MRFLRYFLVVCFFSFFLNFNISAQDEDPEPPPGMQVPLSGAEWFYLVALTVGGILIYGQRRKSKLAEKKEV